MKKYTNRLQIREGSFGNIFKAIRRYDQQEVLIKEIKVPNLINIYGTLVNDIYLLKQLNHENIIQYYECFKFKGNFFIVMKFVEGSSLKEIIDKAKLQNHRFDINFIMKTFAQILAALKHCKENSIIHRNIRPENIMLTSTGLVKLINFGIPSIISNVVKTRLPDNISTIYSYMSPEIINGGDYSFENDIWSFGVILYELFVFEHPFQGNALYNLLDNIVNSDFNPFPDRTLPEITNLVKMMLKKEPSSRIVIEDIEKIPFIFKFYYDSDQLNDLGWKAFYGIGVPQDKKLSYQYFRFAIDENNIEDLYNIAQQLRKGFFGEKLYSEALPYYKKAADGGNSDAMVCYARGLKNGILGEVDFVGARKYFKMATQAQHPKGLFNYALLLQNEKSGKKDLIKSMNILHSIGSEGNSKAQFLYANGLGKGFLGKPDAAQAMEIYQQLSDSGNTKAMLKCAEILKNGELGETNYEKAMKYYKKAGENGCPMGYVNYGLCLLKGCVGPSDPVTAMKYFKMAADAKDPTGMNNYGQGLLRGFLGQKNTVKAMKYFRAAYELGCTKAMISYAKGLKKGYLGQKDPITTMKLYKKAADNNDSEGMYKYARGCEKGLNGTKDLLEAKIYYEKAISAGYTKAKPALEHLETQTCLVC